MMYLLLFSIAIFAITAIWAIKCVGKTKDETISQHIAKSKLTQAIFGINGSIASALASIVLFSWILPHNHAGLLSYFVFIVLTLFFFISAIVPFIEGTWRGTIHNIAAWGMCFIIPIVILLTLFWKLDYLTMIDGLVTLVVLCILLLLSAFRKDLRKEFLAFQSSYLSLFFIYLVVLSIR